MFNVGDMVVALESASSITKGKTYFVDFPSGEPGRTQIRENDAGRPDGWGTSKFALAHSTKKSQLQILVDTANAGYRAIDILAQEHNRDVNFVSSHGGKLVLASHSIMTSYNGSYPIGRSFEIIQKTIFPQFRVGSWDVRMENERLHIGCKHFDPSAFLSKLRDYKKPNESAHTKPSSLSPDLTRTKGGRYGITFNFGEHQSHDLKWEDADKIQAALEKAGIK